MNDTKLKMNVEPKKTIIGRMTKDSFDSIIEECLALADGIDDRTFIILPSLNVEFFMVISVETKYKLESINDNIVLMIEPDKDDYSWVASLIE